MAWRLVGITPDGEAITLQTDITLPFAPGFVIAVGPYSEHRLIPDSVADRDEFFADWQFGSH